MDPTMMFHCRYHFAVYFGPKFWSALIFLPFWIFPVSSAPVFPSSTHQFAFRKKVGSSPSSSAAKLSLMDSPFLSDEFLRIVGPAARVPRKLAVLLNARYRRRYNFTLSLSLLFWPQQPAHAFARERVASPVLEVISNPLRLSCYQVGEGPFTLTDVSSPACFALAFFSSFLFFFGWL